MDGKSRNPRDWSVARLADRQHGVVSRGQLLEAGLSSQVIDGSIAAGRLRPLMTGVYAVGHLDVPKEAWWHAALLACGDGSALSHMTAATLWRIAFVEEVVPVDVIVVGHRGRQRRQIRARRMSLHPSEFLTFDRMRVTTPARTIVDLASLMSDSALRRAVERAQDMRRFNEREIAAIIERNPRRAGVRPLADLLRLLGPDRDNARSYLERIFLALLRAAGIPLPLVNQVVLDRRRDFVWPDRRLVVETDGYKWHSSREARSRDARRDRELTAAGWRVARFTFEEVTLAPTAVVADLRLLLT
jgi:very-short-patch-repair endonuclease